VPDRLTLATHPHGPDHAAWLARFPGVRARDIYPGQVAELAEVRLPGGPARERDAFIADYQAREPGFWSHYPWLNLALRTLEPGALYELRTNRNRNLITAQEQAGLRQARVSIAGLSVGASILAALLRHGIGGTFSLADRDELATSNLNRTPGGLPAVGLPKCQLAAHAVWELDPFATCLLYPDGLDDDTAGAFVADASASPSRSACPMSRAPPKSAPRSWRACAPRPPDLPPPPAQGLPPRSRAPAPRPPPRARTCTTRPRSPPTALTPPSPGSPPMPPWRPRRTTPSRGSSARTRDR